jgi:hypothetical protein
MVITKNELHLSSLTLSGGRVGLTSSNGGHWGGSIAIYAGALLYLTNVTINGCGKDVACAFYGGALYVSGKAFIIGSTFVSNRASSSADGVLFVHSSGHVQFENTNFTNNRGVVQIGGSGSMVTFAGGDNIFSRNIENIRHMYKYRNIDRKEGTNFSTCPPSTYAPVVFPPLQNSNTAVLRGLNFKGCPYTCPPGTHAPGFKMRQENNATKWCYACPAGYYNPDPKLFPTCLFCPGSKSTPFPGAISITECTGMLFIWFSSLIFFLIGNAFCLSLSLLLFLIPQVVQSEQFV